MLAHGKFRSIGIMFANRFQDRFVPVKLFDMLTCRAASIKLEGELCKEYQPVVHCGKL